MPEALPITLEDSEHRFGLLVQSVVDYGILLLDVTGHVSSWNLGAQRMKGYAPEEIIGKHFSIFYPPQEVAASKCERALEIAAREGRFEEEGFRLRKEGSQFWANVVLTAIRTRSGQLIGFGEVTRDLSERRLAERDLRASEERLRLLIESVKDYAIFQLDVSGHIASWNPGAQRLKGYTLDEIQGKHFSIFYPQEDIDAGKCEMELEVAQREGRFEEEGIRVRKDGSRFWANVVITPIRGQDATLLGFAKVTRDLTERRRHEEERLILARTEQARKLAEENESRVQALAESLREARDKAEESTRMKDEFLATVSHELRTPLNAILGWARMLQTKSMSAEQAQRAIDSVVRNAIAQNQIIDDLLDVSRIITGQLRLDVEVLDANQVVAAAVEVVRPAADAKGVRLVAVLNPDAGVIRGDAGRLQQVMWNLLHNGVKFTPRGGRVQVTLEREHSSVRIEVADSGNGIDPGFLPRIFDRFSQQDATKSRRTGGLGLGLAIVKHLVELHGGMVEAHSEGVGRGSSFVITIPLAPVRNTPVQPTAAPTLDHEVVLPEELRGLRVLVVDDEPDARELVQAVLERGGATVTMASNAGDALALVTSDLPDVIVSDIGMPDEDGYAFIRALRALPREQGGRIPAVALTAYARAEDRRKALVSGFQNHAAKPIEPQELVIVVANLVGRYG